MPTWNEIDREIESLGAAGASDQVRQKYLKALEAKTGRPVIAYYSGWLQKRAANGQHHPECSISDLDMNGFMAVVHGLPRDAGLDLILHTPGGGIEAARALVGYLYQMFGKDIRVVVPQLAMSAGTMIACAARQIVMGKHSSLGPTDPQVKGAPAMGIIAEVDQALREIKADPLKQLIWTQVFAKYPPAFILDCERSIEGTKSMVSAWLRENMLSGEANPAASAAEVVGKLMDYRGTSEHGQHFLLDKCEEIGLKIARLEDDQDLQELVLSVHHTFVASFTRTKAIKIIDNAHTGSWVIDG